MQLGSPRLLYRPPAPQSSHFTSAPPASASSASNVKTRSRLRSTRTRGPRGAGTKTSENTGGGGEMGRHVILKKKAHLRKYKNNMNWEKRPKRTRKTQGSDPDLQPSRSNHFISFIYSSCLCHALLCSNIHFIRSKQSSKTVQEHLHVLSQLSCRQFCQMQSTLRIHLISSLHNYSWN